MTPQELKNSIIQFAIRGRLVEQRSEEGSANDLYSLIKAENKSKGIYDNKKMEPIKEDVIPFDIPDSWRWVRFGEIADYNMGKTPPRAEAEWWKPEHPWVSIADMPENGHITSTKECVSMSAIKKKFGNKVSQAGTMIMSFKLTVGRVSILDIDAVHNEAIISIYPFCDADKTIQSYLFKILPMVTQYGETKNAIKGKTLNGTSICNLLIPLPPLSEQKRIVAKIEELLPYIDRYKQAWSKLDNFNKRFPSNMQKSILQIALQGKLVEQCAGEGSADVLYSLIQAEKKNKGIYDSKKMEPITEEVIPYDIPDSWRWVRFGDIVDYNMGKTPPRAEAEWWKPEHPWVSIADMPENGHITSTKECVSMSAIKKKFGNKVSQAGTMIMSFKLTVGRVSILDIDAVHNEAIISIYPFCDADKTIQSYLFKILPMVTQYGETKNAIKGKTLNDTSICNLLIPLPPLSEQKRIVAKIEEILPLCENLKSKVSTRSK